MNYERILARTYDVQYAQLRADAGDVAFYGRLAAERGGPVLELGCGTGRVLLPIARAGLPCVGVDPSPEMLAVLREQAPPQNLELVEATMQTLALGRRDFALAYSAFRAFQHLLTVDDQLAALTRAREHLRDDGWLALDVFDPDLARMARDEPETDDDPFEWEGRTIKRTYEVHRERATQTMQVIFRYYDVDSGAQLGREELAMRWVYRYELEHLLWRAGFEPLRWSSAYDGRPYDGRGEIVVVARRR